MSRPHLTTFHPDDFELSLLRSAEADEPRTEALSKTAGALGITIAGLKAAGSATALAATSARAATRAAAGATATVSPPIGILSASATFVAKNVVIGLLAGLASGGAVQWATTATAPRESAPHAALGPAPEPTSGPSRPINGHDASLEPNRAPLEPAETEQGPEPDAPPLAPPVVAQQARGQAKGRPARVIDDVRAAEPAAPVAPSAGMGEGNASSLGEEVAMLDRARAARHGGQPARALSELDAYERTWPAGVLAPEAAALRIETLLDMGKREAAENLARAFVTAHPGGRHARRFRALLEADEAK